MPVGRPKRWAICALVVLGLGLVAMPVVFQLFDRAPKGARMIADFRPYMTSARLGGYQTELREIDAGVKQGATTVAARISGAPASGRQRSFAARFPDFAAFEQQWGGIYADMSGMLTTIRGNLGNYRAVAALPSFTLFPWFFVLPGVIVLGLLGLGLARPSRWRTVRAALVVLGLGLVLAPAVFQMFSRAPKGGHMIDSFKTIETRARVERIQGYFGEIAIGQGAVTLELIPALRRSGLSASEISASYPQLTTFAAQWVHVLNDMTPMIGAMSDNVVNYDAVAALPPFALFPWFFVLPGVLVVAFTVAGRGRHQRRPLPDQPSEFRNSTTEGVT